jgi:hypothetical protein
VLTGAPNGPVTVTSHRALPMGLGGGGYGRSAPATEPGTVTVTVAADGSADATDLASALAAFPLNAVSRQIRIRDSTRYSLGSPLAIPPHSWLVISASDGQWPVIQGGLAIDGGVGSQVLLDGLLVTGGPLTVTGSPAGVRLRHSTMVPGEAVGPDLVPVAPDRPSVVMGVLSSADTELVLDHCLSGPVVGEADSVRLVCQDTLLVSSSTPTPDVLDVCVLVGEKVTTLAGLPARPVLKVHLGAGTTLDLQLPSAPTTLAEAAGLLEEALRQAVLGESGSGAISGPPGGDDLLGPGRAPEAPHVRIGGGRLCVISTDLQPISFSAAGGSVDGTADVLGLTTQAYRAVARICAPLAAPAAMKGVTGEIDVAVWDQGGLTQATVTVPALPDSLDGIAATLTAAVQAGPDAAAVVVTVSGRLLLVPGVGGRSLQPGAGELADRLGLRRALPVVAGTADGLSPGPVLRADRTTFLGDVLVRSVSLSDAVVTGRLVASRRQTGCLRYSWVGAGSLTPRQFRSRSGPGDPAPVFVSTTFGRAAFGQLAPGCPDIVAQGAENGSEMGALNDVGQPERLAAVQSLLGEYLRFSAEAGIFLAS